MTKTAAPAPAGTPEVPKAEREIVSRWKKEIALAEERELKWRKEAKEATEIYEGEKATSEEFNILYANTETIRPHLYGGSPKISVRPRYQRSQVAKVAAQVLQKALEYVVDPGNPETASFDLALRASSTSALVTDRGVVWVGYNAKFAEIGEAAEEAAEAPEPKEGLERRNRRKALKLSSSASNPSPTTASSAAMQPLGWTFRGWPASTS